MKLLIALPALDEDESIESIIERSLEARKHIVETSPVTDVDITVVSDGSTDRTVELASRYTDQIKLIVFEANRGYGAAIKEAWRQSDADILGFLDADGTCDPRFFADLSRSLVAEQADVVLGGRLNPDSKMPLVRKLGNKFFALLLSVFSAGTVKDTASGMRVVRRGSLPDLLPLPDGLHFTPAMSARAMISASVKIVEIPMTYEERSGESKLSPIKDGIRFLTVILEMAFLYRPSRPLVLAGLLFLGIATGLMITPTLHYMRNSEVEEWMIYRFIVCNLLGSSGLLLLSVGYLSKKIVDMTIVQRSRTLYGRVTHAIFSGPWWWVGALGFLLLGGFLVLSSFLELVETGETYEHWSRYIVMSFFVQIALVLVVTRVFAYILDLIEARLLYLDESTREQPS